ncbi:MAG: hypothetical protein R3Y38_02530 [Rikenellaceae bacterium]
MRVVKVFFLSLIAVFAVLTSSAETLNYKGTFSVYSEETSFEVMEVKFNITLDLATSKAKFSTVGMQFGPGMPVGLTIDFSNIPFTKDDKGEYLFEQETTGKPTANGEPFGNTRLRNFYAQTDKNTISVTFDAGSKMAVYEGEKCN